MRRECDVAVVGVGAMGSATCDALARRGVNVVGLERFDLPHDRGSSGGQTRLIRKGYWEHPSYVPLLDAAYRCWDDLAERAGAEVLVRAGCLYAGAPDGDLVTGTARSCAEHDLDVEELDRDELRRRFPQFELPEGFRTLFEPDAGLMLCERAIALHAEQARLGGAEIRCRETVRSWREDAGGVTLETDRGTLDAGHVVFTAGAWTAPLLAELGIGLRVHRQVIAWVWPGDLEAFSLGRFPCWAIEPPDEDFEGIWYGFPALPGHRVDGPRGIKLGHHFLGPVVDPDTVDREAGVADEDDWRPCLERYIPGGNGTTSSMKVCLYTSTPDEHFVVDRHPGRRHVTVGCGFSGHGFKFASVMGEVLADLALDGRSDHPVDFLGVERLLSADG